MIDSDEPSDVAIAQKRTISCFDISCGNVTSRFIVVRVERWSEIFMDRLNNDSLLHIVPTTECLGHHHVSCPLSL